MSEYDSDFGELLQWVVYDHPKDHPDKWVLRRWRVLGGSVPEGVERIQADGEAILGDSLDDVRKHIPEGSLNLGRFPGDDPVIHEVWM